MTLKPPKPSFSREGRTFCHYRDGKFTRSMIDFLTQQVHVEGLSRVCGRDRGSDDARVSPTAASSRMSAGTHIDLGGGRLTLLGFCEISKIIAKVSPNSSLCYTPPSKLRGFALRFSPPLGGDPSSTCRHVDTFVPERGSRGLCAEVRPLAGTRGASRCAARSWRAPRDRHPLAVFSASSRACSVLCKRLAQPQRRPPTDGAPCRPPARARGLRLRTGRAPPAGGAAALVLPDSSFLFTYDPRVQPFVTDGATPPRVLCGPSPANAGRGVSLRSRCRFSGIKAQRRVCGAHDSVTLFCAAAAPLRAPADGPRGASGLLPRRGPAGGGRASIAPRVCRLLARLPWRNAYPSPSAAL